jgi:endo-1,4-beta-D-glucanase Y
MKKFLVLLCLSGLIFILIQSVACSSSNAAGPHHPFPQHVTYAPGTLRPNHRTQAQQDADVRAFYDQWKADYLVSAGQTGAGNPLYRVSFGTTNPGRTVSEGQGYGMIIVATMAGHDPQAQTLFDGLWEFSREYPSVIDDRLMGWQVPPDPGGSDSAFDGDADIAYGLLLADKQWGSQGRINYKAAAEQVIAGIYESTIGPDSHLPMLGDWVSPNGGTYNQYTPRSSDFMPAHFRAYGRATANPAWTEVISRSQAVISSLQANHSPATGLLPDFIEPVSTVNHTPRPADPGFLEGATDGSYYYNAGRDPWRLGTDALLNNDPASLAQTRKISAWAATTAGGLPANIKAGYQLDGTPLPSSNYFTTFFAAPLGVAAMTKPDQQAWLNAIYDAVYNRHEDYYEDSVTLLCLLVMTGNYWDPTSLSAENRLYLPFISQ